MSASPGSAIMLTSLNPDAVPKCNTHRKRLKFFCSKHELLLCSVCAVKRHRGCEEVLTINEACDDKRSEGKKLLDLYGQRIALIENAIVERKAAKKLLDSNAQEIQNEIHEVTQRLIDLVKHEERTLLESLHTMQGRESETLDKDIKGLDVTYNHVKGCHDNLSHSLKLTDVDLIHAIIKEKQQVEDNTEVENIVKKSFREIDFKFIISPHVTSFLKHFKSLGQVMLSDDRNNNSSRSSSSLSINDIPSSPGHRGGRRGSDGAMRPQHNSPEESPQMTARERWQRDRQTQRQLPNHQLIAKPQSSEDGNVFQFGPFINSQGNNQQSQTERRNQPMRALPRSATPEVYERPRNQAQRRDFIARPMSTPPVQSQMIGNSPKARDVDRYTQGDQYRFVKAEPVIFSDRRSPIPLRNQFSPQNDSRGGRADVHHSEPVHVFQRQNVSNQLNSPPDERPPSRTMSPNRGEQQVITTVNVKDDDINFGRTFAAVQITDTRPLKGTQSLNGNTRNDDQVRPTAARPNQIRQIRTSSDGSLEPPPYSYKRPNSRQSNGEHVFESGRNVSPTASYNSMATDEEKGRRWVHQTAFNSNGIGPKRLITGIGMLQDGRIVLVDQEHYTVQLYSKNCKFLYEIKLDSRPFDVCILSDSKLVVSLQSERVLKFVLVTNDTLTPVADLGVPCDLVCYGICRGPGHYCVCCGDEVWILSDEGRVLNRIKHDKEGNQLFLQAEYVCTDKNSDVIFVSDSGNQKIYALHIDGKRKWEFTYQGFHPAGIKFYDQCLYVCERDQHRVLMLNSDGQVVKQSVVGRLENPQAISFSPSSGTMFVSQLRYEAIVSPSQPIHMFSLQ